MLDKTRQAAIFQQLAEIGGALSNPHRLKMVGSLTQGEKSIDELARLTDQSLAAASANVKVLRNSHLVKTDKRGRSVFCSLADPIVAELWLRFRDLGETIVPEIREVVREEFDADDALSPLTIEEFHQKLDRGRFTLVDLRPTNEFAEGHLPKARSVPFAVLTEQANQLPKSSPMFVYCRGPYCAAAMAGTHWLRDHRFKSQRLRFSVPEWRAAGFDVEV
ncbi:ArsR/SmtB family transcription factor [Aporhodopirellula aestuarii]|uniref:Metalloregulator ArsR/SmtB family transcription factor n=1 Tax=Aporhodopirellula aestuarii TaxID=2950107 RepID=A0ABT0U0I0_9BACT|nr:metalloregulator ArsR/SmtB family transcription factor [Aporhodopirellula aestuarii]MCM2370149.1 metalloregulator ArsR/SmtB family transcription factor [Aporhodopirellula aestuarii]